jgi:hydroxyethylthiazole kinase-like uncharacterized protein yjeF
MLGLLNQSILKNNHFIMGGCILFIVTSEEMRKLDHYMIQVVGVSAAVLMENAGRAVAAEIQAFCAESDLDGGAGKKRKKCWVVLAGKGNNGGDGFVTARHLWEAGFDVLVVIAESQSLLMEAGSNIKTDAVLQQEIAARLGITVQVYKEGAVPWQQYDGVVDALLGTGSQGAPRELYAALIREANASGLPIIAVDIPSGLDADTGVIYEPCIRATVTVALAFIKCGLVQYPGAEIAGKVVVRSIGIPPQLAGQQGIQTYWLQEELFAEHLGLDPSLPRSADSNKGTYGHLLVAAGTRQMSGAGLMCSGAALRTGCGLVSWAMPDCLIEPMIGRMPELMLHGVPDGKRGDWAETSAAELIKLAENKAALVLGPGMGRFPQDGAWLRAIWEGTTCPLVLDADALNMIADAADFASWGRRAAAVILTPHPGEMARLLGVPVHEVQRDRIALSRRFAFQHGLTLVLKGARTVCATPEGVVYVNTTGNPGMATAGAGDVLAGMLGSLLAQGLSAAQAASLGVYLHGAAGDRAAAQRFTAGSLLASDIIAAL